MSNVIQVAENYLGYYEKDRLSDIYTSKRGSGNFTKFAAVYKDLTGENYQGQAWCAMFVSCCFAEAYGIKKAKEMLGGEFFAYTPTGANNFRKKNRFVTNVREANIEDLVFFSNGGQRIDHVGIIAEKGANTFKTIEGNASNSVTMRTYSYNDSRIKGVGLTMSGYVSGWKYNDSVGKWNYIQNGNKLTNGFYYINGILFHFDETGAMSEGQFFANGKRYYSTTSIKPITGAVIYICDGDSVKKVDNP